MGNCGIFLNTGCVEAIESIIWVVISLFVQISWSVKNYLLFQVFILLLVYKHSEGMDWWCLHNNNMHKDHPWSQTGQSTLINTCSLFPVLGEPPALYILFNTHCLFRSPVTQFILNHSECFSKPSVLCTWNYIKIGPFWIW